MIRVLEIGKADNRIMGEERQILPKTVICLKYP